MAATLSALLKPGLAVPKDKGWDKRNRQYLFWGVSYRGGADYKGAKDADGQPVFIAHELESASGVDRRKRLAVYRNYCRAIVDQFNNFIFSNPIKRDKTNVAFSEWSLDVDGAGTTFHDFMKRAARNAAIYGQWFVTVDTTKTDPLQTQAQARAAGNRAFAIHVHPAQVLAIKTRGEEIIELLVEFPELKQVRAYDAVTMITATVRDGFVQAIGDEEPHGYDRVPFVRVESMGECESQIRDIAEVNKSLFNLQALHAEELQRQTFTQYVLAGLDAADLTPADPVGGRKFLCVNRPASDIAIHKLAADPTQAASIREAIDADTKEIYRLAGLWTPEVAQGVESGRALKIRFNQVALNAAAIADYAEKAENGIIALWQAATGSTVEIANSDYPEEFDVEELGQELDRALKLMSGNFPWVLQREQILALVNRICPKLDDASWALLHQELDFMGELAMGKRMQESGIKLGEEKSTESSGAAPAPADAKQPPADADAIGKVPLALQQLALAKQRAIQDGDVEFAAKVNAKMGELLQTI